MNNQNNNSWSTDKSHFVRKYVGLISLIICLVILSSYWGFSNRTSQLLHDQIIEQARGFHQQLLLIREWISMNQGVFVKFRENRHVWPEDNFEFKRRLTMNDPEGNKYILRNSSEVLKELSDLAFAKGLVKFKATSLNPINETDKPDPFEVEALAQFTQGNLEFYRMENSGDEHQFRYAVGLKTTKKCMKCHKDYDYVEGEFNSGISLKIPATVLVQQQNYAVFYTIASGVGIVILVLLVIYFLYTNFIKVLIAADERLVTMATRDVLTGLYNRQSGFEIIEAEMERARRNHQPLHILMLDVDHFKMVNDTYGHHIGDMVLQHLGGILEHSKRRYDYAFRYGGEEFVVFLSELSDEGAVLMAERIRQNIMKSPVEVDDTTISYTASFGLARWDEKASVETLVNQADTALYQAKEKGRNRVETSFT